MNLPCFLAQSPCQILFINPCQAFLSTFHFHASAGDPYMYPEVNNRFETKDRSIFSCFAFAFVH